MAYNSRMKLCVPAILRSRSLWIGLALLVTTVASITSLVRGELRQVDAPQLVSHYLLCDDSGAEPYSVEGAPEYDPYARIWRWTDPHVGLEWESTAPCTHFVVPASMFSEAAPESESALYLGSTELANSDSLPGEDRELRFFPESRARESAQSGS